MVCETSTGAPVDRECHAADRQDVKAGRGHDHVGGECAARVEDDAVGGDPFDPVGDDVGRAAADRAEEVGVWDGTEPLVPRVVGGGQVQVDLEVLGQPSDRGLAQDRLHQLGASAAELVGEHRIAHVLDPHEVVGELGRQDAAQTVGIPVARGHRRDVGGGALQHRHVRRGLRHRGHECDGGRAAADDHDPLAGVVEVGRPVLRMHDGADELVGPGDGRAEAPRHSGSSRSTRRGTNR